MSKGYLRNKDVEDSSRGGRCCAQDDFFFVVVRPWKEGRFIFTS